MQALKIFKIFKYSVKPFTILFPIPLVPFIVGLYAGGFKGALSTIILTFLFYPAVNLWNHINDAEEDVAAGKDNPFTEKGERILGLLLVSFLYPISFFHVLVTSKSFGVFLFFIAALMTFLYSDNMITKLRLKKHYVTELLTYILTVPSFLLALYDVVRPIDSNALILTLALTFLLLSTVVLKDFKDISEDRVAGLKTLAIVYSPQTLLKIFFFLLLGYFFMLFVISVIISPKYLITLLPLVGILYSAREFIRENWEVSLKIVKSINVAIISGILSLTLFGVAQL